MKKPIFGLVLKVERINYPPFYALNSPSYAYWHVWIRRYFFFKKKIEVRIQPFCDITKTVGTFVRVDPSHIVVR